MLHAFGTGGEPSDLVQRVSGVTFELNVTVLRSYSGNGKVRVNRMELIFRCDVGLREVR